MSLSLIHIWSEFLNAMLAYFGYHLDAISAVQSVRILKEVF